MNMRVLLNTICLLTATLTCPQIVLAADRGFEPDPRVLAIYETLRMSVERLHAVEYTAHFDRTQHIDISGTNDLQELHYELEYAFDGNLYFSRARFTGGNTGISYDRQWAYDGQAYQKVDADKGALFRSAFPHPGLPMRSGMLQPLVVPFRFAFGRDVPLEFKRLQAEEPWKELARRSKLGEPQLVDGHECETVVVDTFNPISIPTRWTACLAKDLEYFPVRLEADLNLDDSVMHNEFLVQAEVIDSTVGKVVMPMRTKQLTYHAGELMLTQVFEIHPKSLRVNQAVDVSTFTIPEELAPGGVYDTDRNMFTRPPKNAPQSANTGPSWTLTTVNLTFLVAVAAFVYYRKRRSNQRI